MTDIDLDAIRARVDAATPGPWDTSGPDTIAEWGIYALERGWLVATADVNDYPDSPFPKLRGGITGDEANRNAEFIAHARTDVPALLARLAEVEAERDAALDRVLELIAACDNLRGLAVRAAAPALRAGALREAADEWQWTSYDADDASDWLRERADREVAP